MPSSNSFCTLPFCSGPNAVNYQMWKITGRIHVPLLSVSLFPLCLALTECSFIHLSGSDCWVYHVTHLLSLLSPNFGWSCVSFLSLSHRDAVHPNRCTMDKLHRSGWIVKDKQSRRRRAHFLTQSWQAEDIMSTLVKQERTICVLLPNKDQLDIAVGVSVYMWASLYLSSLWRVAFWLHHIIFGQICHADFLLCLFPPAAAQVHRARCLQPCGWAPGNQRAALFWPHNGKRWADGLRCAPAASHPLGTDHH